MRNSSTRPSSIAAAARPAPPIETSLSVASSAAAASSATDASASRALPRTLSSVRLKTTFGIAHQHRLVQPAAAQIAAELAYVREVETKQLLARGRPPERALTVGDQAVHRDAHRVDQHGFKLVAPQRRTMIAMTFTIGLGIGLSCIWTRALHLANRRLSAARVSA